MLSGMHTARRRGALVFCALLTAALLPATAPAQQLPGFDVRYAAPEGWSLSGQDGRIQAWSNADGTAALVFYAGHFGSLSLALGDAQRVLGVPAEEDTRIIAPLTPTAFHTHDGLAGSVRIVGEHALVSHVAVVQLDDSTMLGGVAVLPAASSDTALAELTASVAHVLSSATVGSASTDTALGARLTGQWTSHRTASAGEGGSYTDDESWHFGADGRYTYHKRFTVKVPGTEVPPEEKDEAGRWYAVGGALVLIGDDGRLTVDVQLANANGADSLLLDGTVFSRSEVHGG